MQSGVLVGCDRSQEWLLSWFFAHFRKANPDCSIAFADFGMTDEGRNWCQSRGKVFPVEELSFEGDSGFVFQGDRWVEWKLDVACLAPERLVCFRKPLALIKSPFQRTLWLDLDCQVRNNLDLLFSLVLSSSGLAAVPCNSFISVKNLSKDRVFLISKFNTGVILVDKRSPLLVDWASLINGAISFRTDEGSLSFLADKRQMPITELPTETNWPIHAWGENPNAQIYHWLGNEAKSRLKRTLDFPSAVSVL